MKPLCLRFRLFLVIFALLSIILVAFPVHAQEGPVVFGGFEPPAGQPGTEVLVTLFGNGFDVIEGMEFIIDDVEVFDWVIESNEVIRLRLFIPPEAPPGPKRVEIHYVVDNTPFQAVIDGGFVVMEPEAPPFVEPVQLFGVEPPEGLPGTEMDITLIGEGFEPFEGFDVGVEGVDVMGWEVESNEVARARIFIPEDAPPGPRRVEVFVLREGQPISAGLEGGFLVQIPEQEGDGDGIPWLWIVLVFIAGGIGYIAGRTLTNRSQPTTEQPPPIVPPIETPPPTTPPTTTPPPPTPPPDIHFIREIEPGSPSIEPEDQPITVEPDVRLETTIESKIDIHPEQESLIKESRPLENSRRKS